MGHDTKVILKAVYEAQSRCKTLDEALKVLASAANVEEVVVEQQSSEKEN